MSNTRLMSTPYAEPALQKAVRYLHEDMRRKFGEKWEAAIIGGPLQIINNLALRAPNNSTLQQGIVGTLFLIGYEVGNEDKISLFTHEIIGLIKPAINKKAAEEYGASLVAKILISILHAGIRLRNRLDPQSVVDFDPGDDTFKQDIPKVFQEFLSELGFK